LSEEELEELEKELEESFGDFDEDIQREKTYAEDRANESNSDDSGDELGGVGEFETYNEREGGPKGKSSSGSASSGSQSNSKSQSASGSSNSKDGEQGEGGNGRENDGPTENNQTADKSKEDAEPDVPDIVENEDIVARQIREAAEAETDPELQKKLWEEYENYNRK